MKNLFKYNDQSLFAISENGEPSFKAQDVAKLLQYKRTETALNFLDEDEKLFRLSGETGQNRRAWFVTESGFYHLVLKSSKPEAKNIRKWVTSVVLPSLRRGMYATDSISKRDAHLKQGCSEVYIKEEDIKIKKKEVNDLETDLNLLRINFWNDFRADPDQLKLFEPESLNLKK